MCITDVADTYRYKLQVRTIPHSIWVMAQSNRKGRVLIDSAFFVLVPYIGPSYFSSNVEIPGTFLRGRLSGADGGSQAEKNA